MTHKKVLYRGVYLHPEDKKHRIYLTDIKKKPIKLVSTKNLSYSGNRHYEDDKETRAEVKGWLTELLDKVAPNPCECHIVNCVQYKKRPLQPETWTKCHICRADEPTPVVEDSEEEDILHTPTPRPTKEPDQTQTFLLNRLNPTILALVEDAVKEKVVWLKSIDEDTDNPIIHKCIRYSKEYHQTQLLSFWQKKFNWDLTEEPFTRETYEEAYPDPKRRKKSGCRDFDIWREYENIMKFAGMKDHTNQNKNDEKKDYLRFNVAYRYYIDEDGYIEDEQDKRLKKTKQIPYKKEIMAVKPTGKKKITFSRMYIKYQVVWGGLSE